MPLPAALESLSPEDRRLFFEYGFGDVKTASFASIPDAFRTHVQSTPNAIAVEHIDDSITYAELGRQSDHLATRLNALGVGTGSRVILLVKRSISMIVGILGVLKAGAAYVPLDAGIVPDRTLGHIVSDAEVKIVLTLTDFSARCIPYDVLTICLDEQYKEPPEPGKDLFHSFTGKESAYIVYTSGTTGTPKGVDVSHSNVLNLITQSPGNLGMRSGMRVSQLLNIAFDMAQWECLGSLVNGCTLCLRGRVWLETLKTVDIVISTPSCLRSYTPSDFQPKVIATAGEPCPQALADRWIASGTTFYNCCGPTETTIVNTVYEHLEIGQKLSIGRPTPNNNVYILDENLKPVPIGDPGMIWAGGKGVAKGYLNLPARTAESFRPDIFVANGEIMYKTGDMGRWRTDGSKLLDILGRADDQVKIKGFRVELDGVAAALETTPGVRVAAALLIDQELVGVYTPDDVDEEDVRTVCEKVQPYYACPSRYIKLADMPMTGNGKIDKKTLRDVITSPSNASTDSTSDGTRSETTGPSSVSEDDTEPHIFCSTTKALCVGRSSIAWQSPSPVIPPRGRLFVNVIDQGDSTFSSRSSIFSRNHTPSRSRPSSDAAGPPYDGIVKPFKPELVPTDHDAQVTCHSSSASPTGASSVIAKTDASKLMCVGSNEKSKALSPYSPRLQTPQPTNGLGPANSGAFNDRLLFAIPKKGRLHEKCIELLKGSDIQFAKSNRLDICMVKNLPIALVFLPAADIPRFVGESNVDMGITGQDVILESKMQGLTTELLSLGFGRCKLQVQVPTNSDIEHIEGLAGKRIATSFESVAGEYFGKIDSRMGTNTRIEYVGGSVETACSLGLADGIVDLVESGETMRAAGLKPIGTIISSEATLILSSRPKKPEMLPLVEQLKSRFAGVVASSKYLLCQYNVRRADLTAAKKITPGRGSATVSSLDEDGWVGVSSMVERESAACVMDELQAVGAEDIIMIRIENCRV